MGEEAAETVSGMGIELMTILSEVQCQAGTDGRHAINSFGLSVATGQFSQPPFSGRPPSRIKHILRIDQLSEFIIHKGHECCGRGLIQCAVGKCTDQLKLATEIRDAADLDEELLK